MNKNKWLNLIPIAAIIILCALLAWNFLGPKQPEYSADNPDPNSVVAKVDDKSLLYKDYAPYRGLWGFLYGYEPEELRDAEQSDVILDKYIEDFLIRRHIEAQGFSASESEVQENLPSFKDYLFSDYGEEEIATLQADYGFDENALSSVLYDFILVEDYITQLALSYSDEQVREYYDANLDSFYNPEDVVVASHILVATEEEARAILKRLEEGEDFAMLAYTLSLDEDSAVYGGNLGSFSRGEMVQEFEDAAFALRTPGELSDIVATTHGYHIIKLSVFYPEDSYLSFEETRDDLASWMANDQMTQEMGQIYQDAVITKNP